LDLSLEITVPLQTYMKWAQATNLKSLRANHTPYVYRKSENSVSYFSLTINLGLKLAH
jgi:hypothetical protein